MTQLIDQCAALRDMLDAGVTYSRSGDQIPLHSHLPQVYAEALYRAVLQQKPQVVVEIGMAFGVASLAILAALRSTGRGRLITIDPAQSSEWHGAGIAAVAKAGFSDLHEFIEDYDYNVLPRLLASGLSVDFAYIDGWHTFDYTLLDWWYIDKMLVTGGVAGFNDCGWPSVTKAIRFVLSHRKYSEIDVGLGPQFVGHSRFQELRRRLAGKTKEQWYARAEDRYFRKQESWEPSFNFFAEF